MTPQLAQTIQTEVVAICAAAVLIALLWASTKS